MPGKWKLERVKGESFSHKFKKERSFRKFSKVEQGILLCSVLILSFFAVTFGVYQTTIANQRKPDPFTTIYAGQSGPVYVPTYVTTQQFQGCDPLDALCSVNV